MLSPELERAVRQLESATETLLAAEFSDFTALGSILDRRARAIMEMAILVDNARTARPSFASSDLERISEVIVRGEEARRKIFIERREVAGEWNRVRAFRRTIGTEASSDSIFDVDL
jgi:hypothetical protein